eukprot:CAMPEP_0179717058 /NCGR_PEP_ID=MMETSP0938-20121108/2191_1 /TAXON_ID=548131 ORGANISM="Ostreococcus mediterraneus, Strain clade-D-RCC1107" /NCGR_SAMPLE_ID=MMETSP0938 /ASSEMBLY_ACC=CAM_ASM_000576 /LENGTH=876 /DNA_ID=CAMNT_0021590805 /DNA_START=1583 /DNA_END=4213 /DNA_ORIENTATION=+
MVGCRSLIVRRSTEIVWIMGSFVFVYTTKQAAASHVLAFNYDVRVAHVLTSVQLIFTGIFCRVARSFDGSSALTSDERTYKYAALMSFFGLLHSISVHGQYVAYVILQQATAVQLLRAAEVWFVLTFGKILGLRELPAMKGLIGLVLMTISVTSVSFTTPRGASLAILITNCAMPMRNIGLKYLMHIGYSISLHAQLTGLFLYLEHVCYAYGLLCIFLAFPSKDLNVITSNQELVMLIVASATAGCFYNLASLKYLHRDTVSTVDHAAFSLAKRLAVLFYSLFVDFDRGMLSNTFIMCLGQILYFGPHIPRAINELIFIKETKKLSISLLLLKLMILVTLLIAGVTSSLTLFANSMSTESISSLSRSNFAFVHLKAFQDCKVERIVCSELVIVSSDKECPQNQIRNDLKPEMCQALFSVSRERSKRRLEGFARVGACVQTGSRVSALVQVNTQTDTLHSFVHDSYEWMSLQSSCLKLRHFKLMRILAPTAYPFVSPPKKGANFSSSPGMDNLGNWIWRYGFSKMMSPYVSVLSANEEQPDVILFSEANTLQLEHPEATIGQIHSMHNLLRIHGVPALLLGIGIQIEYASYHSTFKNFSLNEAQTSFLAELSSKQHDAVITVRGNLTKTACINAGIMNCEALGCPSLTINRHARLGLEIQNKFEKFRNKIMVKAVARIAISFPAFPHLKTQDMSYEQKSLLDILLRVFVEHDSYIILQAPYDEYNVRLLCAKRGLACNFERLIYFTEPPEWINFLLEFDAMLGARIHGTMAGIAAGIPSLIVPTDMRTEELAKTMLIPNRSMKELADIQSKCVDSLSDCLLRIFSVDSFNHTLFDLNRKKVFAQYTRILTSVGIAPDVSLVENTFSDVQQNVSCRKS